jgi:hypothetical protein
MPNAYNNQASNVPPAFTKIAIGQKVTTALGIGTITDLSYRPFTIYATNMARGNSLIATILIPGSPPIILQQTYNTLLFCDSAVGGEVGIPGQFDSNL